jgi:hypothetical protein
MQVNNLSDEACIEQPLDFSLHCFYLLFRHFVELLLLGLCVWVDLQFVLNYLSAYPTIVRGGPCRNIIVFVEES